jgi:purine-binding chemotaxis protein CheW
VIQVARLAAAAIEPPPAVLEGIDRDFVNGIGRFDGQMLILLNLGKILDLNLF